ncbi:hypothetical protein PTTG_26743 [Puccinia triticina 1-1 BBBD Race 1]|uniref:Uncharacterized protein n=2 Tax=Puccinia triticina TaxID=208348 RepID=A0A180GS62_PUCT1|nr:uncharacterized protein PtA15_11A305 [Puccinia triticina]OAV95219.1 hypothetical protein PTTG_26743 [Puccinia triticina 1-1 BBBD Race 1]WAQ89615.1 hypothetical protein PtA15_11A305 [Puccinia triticina]
MDHQYIVPHWAALAERARPSTPLLHSSEQELMSTNLFSTHLRHKKNQKNHFQATLEESSIGHWFVCHGSLQSFTSNVLMFSIVYLFVAICRRLLFMVPLFVLDP